MHQHDAMTRILIFQLLFLNGPTVPRKEEQRNNVDKPAFYCFRLVVCWLFVPFIALDLRVIIINKQFILNCECLRMSSRSPTPSSEKILIDFPYKTCRGSSWFISHMICQFNLILHQSYKVPFSIRQHVNCHVKELTGVK